MKNRIITLLIIITTAFTPGQGEISKQKKQELADKLYGIELSGGDHLGYSSEILQHLEKSSGIRPGKYKSNSFDDVDRLNTRGRDMDIYSLLSGGLAIRESLRLESIRPGDESMRDVNISLLPEIKTGTHNYDSLIKSRTFKTYPVDKAVPENFYYIHFNNPESAFSFFNYINDTDKALHNRFSPASVDFMIKEKILKQLALREFSESQSFYVRNVEDIVITGSDPFIMEGSDVTLLIRPVKGSIFNSSLFQLRNSFRVRFSAEEKETVISNIKGNHLYTKDRSIWSFFFSLPDGTIVISNSDKAVEAVIDTLSGKRRSLADSGDYRYMRSIYPADKNTEDGFIYLSDRFIRYMVSPELKIKEARRVYEAMKMSVLEKYIIFHYQLTGQYPSSVNEVMESAGGGSVIDARKNEIESIKKNPLYAKSVRLEQKDLSDWELFRKALTQTAPKTKTRSRKKKRKGSGAEDFIYSMKLLYKNLTGKQAYTPSEVLEIIEAVNKPGGIEDRRFSGLSIIPGTFTVKSETYGRINNMIPLIEIETGNVSKREADEYRKFASAYNSFWKDYSDPVGVKLKTGNSISFEACIMPPANNQVYSLLSVISGGTPVELHPDNRIKGDTTSIAFKVNPGIISQYLYLWGFTDDRTSVPGDTFTGEIQLHISDALPLADFDSVIFPEFFTGNLIRSSEVLTGFLAWSLFHPMRIAVPVKRKGSGIQLADSIITRLINGNGSNNNVQYESYISVYNRYEMRVAKLTLFNSLVTRVYICEKDNILHIASTEKYMKDILDMTPAPVNQPVKGNAVLIYRPSEMKLEKDIYRSGFTEKGLQRSLDNFGTIKLMAMLFPGSQSRDIPDLAYRNFGFKPVCPLGGEYYYDRNSDEVKNSLYGDRFSPVLRIDDRNSGIVPSYLRYFFKVSEIRMELEFTPEGTRIKFICR